LIGAAALLGLYLVLHLAVRSGLGGGDVKLAGVLGLHLGWVGWPTLVVGAFAGFMIGGMAALSLIAMKRATMTSRVPFGPSMVAGAILAIAIGNDAGSTLLGG
jgi:leader peptidase (prepilin peptidase)/N-methyltransferase